MLARQPITTTEPISTGTKTSCPAEAAAPNSPSTSPRRATNHRFATAAPSTAAAIPVPIPLSTPHNKVSCHREFIAAPAAVLTAIRDSPTSITARAPKRSIRRPAKGPERPYSSSPMETAKAMASRLQPNSSSRGWISTLGAARTPAEISRVTNVTAATTQA